MKIKINDKEYGLNWGFGAIRITCDLLDEEYEKVIEMVLGAGEYKVLERSKAVTTFILAAAQNYANLNNTDFDINFFQVEAWRDNATDAQKLDLNQDIMQSNIMGKTYGSYLGIAAETPVKTSKKKSVSQKSA